MTRVLQTILFFLFTMAAYSQNFYFDNYGVADEFQSKVKDIVQDDNHYIWLGTQSGVSIFDGNTFENKGVKDGLAPGSVQALMKDSRGRIWMGHYNGGLSIYENQNIKQIFLSNIEIKGDITSILEDNNGNIWITTWNSGAYQIKNPVKTDSLEAIQFKGSNLSDRVIKCVKLNDGTLLFITDVGIKKYIKDSLKFESYQLKGLDLYFQFLDVFQDSKGNIWFGTYNGGLYKHNPNDEKITYYDEKDGLADNWIKTIKEDHSGNIWVGTWEGGISCFRENGSLVIFNTENGLQDKSINCIYEDAEGNILIGTQEHGLSVFKGFQFVSYTQKNGLIGNQVKAICQDKNGDYWFGTNMGITQYIKDRNIYNSFNKSSNNIYNDINCVTTDQDGNLWFGTNGNGVYKYILDNNKFEYDVILNNKLMAQVPHVNAILSDKQNQLWIATNDGLVYYEINKRVGNRLSQISGLAGNIVKALYLDKENVLWIGSQGKGITRFYNDDSRFEITKGLENISPTGFTQDAQGRMWIATETDGIVVFSNDSIQMKITQKDGLLSDMVTLLVADKNNVYIGTHRGLNIYNMQDTHIYAYTKKAGFTGIETKRNASLIDKTGNIWFGTVDGAIKFNPGEERKNIQEPFTHIESILVNEVKRNLSPGVKLKHYENKLTFNFYSVCLTDPNSIYYQYKLVPEDNEWQPVTKSKQARYNALKSGKYTFMVRAKNHFGIWNEIPAEFDYFIIGLPFYKTPWFIITCILMGIFSIFSYIKIRERNLIREKRHLENTVKLRTAELQEKKDQLEIYNKDITDSIQYAQRIQFAMLPSGPPFEDTFVFFKPKDIVSGDFYWFQQQDNKDFLAAVDCTGHGVPGAFMSFIGYNTLNKIVKEYNIFNPAKILENLNREVISILHKKKSSEDYGDVKDGMDLSLVCYDKDKSELTYAGAYNSLYLIRNGELIETKADRVAIGHDEKTKYTANSTKILKGDAIYLFSDGYADQFGGGKRKKFMTANFKRLLISIQQNNMDEQCRIIEERHNEWKGKLEQVDDILVIGRRF